MATVEDLENVTQSDTQVSLPEPASVPVTPAPTVPTAPAVQPQTIETVSQSLGVPTPVTPQVTPETVYSQTNTQQAFTQPAKRPDFEKMEVDELAQEIAKAKTAEELEQANIMNRAVRQGVNVGEAAHRQRLSTANINALSNLMQAKQVKLAQEQAERQEFMSLYGADPDSRPKGMSKKEFQAQLMAGGNTPMQIEQNLAQAQLSNALAPAAGSTGTWSATTDSDGNSVLLNNKTGEVRPMETGTNVEKTPEMQAIESELLKTAGQDTKVDPQAYLQMRENFADQKTFDNLFGGLLSADGASFVNERGGFTAPTQTGSSKAREIAEAIMTPGSTLKLSGLSVKQQAAVQQELNKLKEEALASGDIYGIIKASSGGKDVDATFLQSFEKGLNVLGQIDDLQTKIDDEATGPIWGIIRSANPYDTKAQDIKAQLTAIVPNLARGIYGEVGVLTDNDVALYARTLPNLTSTEDVREAVLAMTLRSVQRSLENKIKSQAAFGRNVSGVEDIYRGIEETASRIESNLSQKTQSNKPQRMFKDGKIYVIGEDGNYYIQ